MTDLLVLQELKIAAAQVDDADCVTGANEIFLQIVGLDLCDVKSHALHDVLAAMDKADGSKREGVYRTSCDGQVKHFRVDRQEGVLAQLVTLRDVSEECSALEDLRTRYELRDRLLHDGQIGTWRYDPEQDLYYFSDELSLGHENIGEPVPTSLLFLIQHPDDREKDAEIRQRITTEGGIANEEIRYQGADGSWTHLLVHYRAGRRLPSGRYEMFGISQSVTDVAVARDEGHKTSQKLEFALRAAGAAVFEYNYTEKKFWISEDAAELLDASEAKVAMKDPMSMVDPEFQDSLRRALANAAGSEGPTVLEIMTHEALGSRWLRFYYDVKQRDEEGNPRLGVGLLLDIDKQKRQEIALAEAQQEAEFANRTKTEFLANMSHELRTPLNAILGFSEMISLRTFGPIGAKYLEYAQDIHTSGQLLLDLVNDVLDLSKLEAGKLELHTTNIDLSSLGPECLALLKARAASNKITLINNIPAGIPLLNADERSVRQILLNFLSNAVKFTPEGGQVELSATVDISGGIVLSVKDSGIGMTPTEAKVALSPFGQIDSEIARKHQGTGLGLPICKSLMELHDGRLTIISKPGQGTSLIAHFPVGRTIVQKAGLTGISAD